MWSSYTLSADWYISFCKVFSQQIIQTSTSLLLQNYLLFSDKKTETEHKTCQVYKDWNDEIYYSSLLTHHLQHLLPFDLFSSSILALDEVDLTTRNTKHYWTQAFEPVQDVTCASTTSLVKLMLMIQLVALIKAAVGNFGVNVNNFFVLYLEKRL